MSGDYLMAVKSIGLSKVGGRKPCTLAGAAKHNKRELAAELEGRGRIDGERVSLNYSLAGADDAAGVIAMALSLMAGIGTSPDKMRRDYCQAVEIVFSLPAATNIDTGQYFNDCVAWCGSRFWVEHILSADVHLDESTPHCHVLIASIQGGRWVGSKVIDRTSTQSLRESFGRDVAKVYGLRMTDKLTGTRKASAAAMVLSHIEAHDRAVISSGAWVAVRQALERNPAAFMDCYGLELEKAPAPKRRTMTQVFTGTGKGPKREPRCAANAIEINPKVSARPVNENSIGFDGESTGRPDRAKPIEIDGYGETDRSLSCVGFQSCKATPLLKRQAVDDGGLDDTRTVERDGDQSHDNFQDSGRVVVDDDGIRRERDYQHHPDNLDQQEGAW